MLKRGGEHELDKIRSKLRPGENVLHVITQRKLVKPSTYFITDQRVLVRDPYFFKDEVQSLMWNDVGDVEISKGPLRASLRFHRGGGGLQQSTQSSFWSLLNKGGGGNVFVLEDVKKSDAEDIYKLVEAKIRENKESRLQAQEQERQQSQQQPQAGPAQSPLDALKMKMVNGEITEEEYERKKKLLE